MNSRIAIYSFAAAFVALPGEILAHEKWLLTPEQIAELSSKPLPEVYTNAWPAMGIASTLILAFLALALLEIRFRPLETRLAAPLAQRAVSCGVVALRWGLAIMMATAALGIMPRHGVEFFSEPTLFVADLHLSKLGEGWAWLAPAQLVLATLLAAGIATRLASLGVAVLAMAGFALFGGPFLSYGLHFLAPALIVFAYGAGRFSVDALVGGGIDESVMKAIRHDVVRRRLESLARSWRALIAAARRHREGIYSLVLFMTGATFVYLGAKFKLANPALLIEILETGGFPTLGLSYEMTALIMTCVEITAGALLACGVLVRPIAFFLIGAFTLFAATLGESPLFHANLYAMMLLFAMAGRCAPVVEQRPMRSRSAAAVPAE